MGYGENPDGVALTSAAQGGYERSVSVEGNYLDVSLTCFCDFDCITIASSGGAEEGFQAV